MTSDERRDVARMLRWFASLHGNVACVTVERTLNLDYSDEFGGGAVTSESVRRLADLIDPTCHVVPFDEESMRLPHCSIYGQPILKPWPNHCPCCGARVVNGDA